MTADDIIDKYLIAKQDRPLFAFPGGSQIGEVKKGLVVGPVYSWVKFNNRLFWQFDYTIPGNVPSAYYSEHKPEFWKISSSGAGNNAMPIPATSSLLPSIVPKWALPVAVGALALFLFKK